MGLLITFLAFIFIIGAGISVYLLFPSKEEAEIKEIIGEKKKVFKTDSLFVRIFTPLILALTPFISQFKFFGYKEKIRKKMLKAGIKEEDFNCDNFIAFKISISILGIIIPFLLYGARFKIIPTIIGFLGLFFLPDFWLGSKLKKRMQEIILTLPYFLDLITLTVEAGLDFVVGIDKVIEKSKPNALRDELMILRQEVQLGATLQDALKNFGNRIDLKEVRFFTNLLVQADKVGASIGKTLRMISDQTRRDRLLKAEIAGARATTNVLFPTMLLILPANMIIIIGAFAIYLLTQGIF
ncbi:MAG: type II secretion system F family protein [Acidobacteriota bacterium]